MHSPPLLLLPSLLLPLLADAANMNGAYRLANAVPGGGWSSEYAEEYFEVYSPPIRTRYSEVFWTMMDPVPIPPAVRERFDGKVIAIRGYEADQVYRTPKGDVRVPIYYQYNHHYGAYIHGKYSEMVEDIGGSIQRGAYGAHKGRWFPRAIKEDPHPKSHIPTNTWFSEGNGGEYRKSYHGYPKGYAQLVDSPTHFQVQPMQIDTHNREYNGTGFVAGPLPREAQSPPGAPYSGLLECPCSTRRKKEWKIEYELRDVGTCDKEIPNETECFEAVAKESPSVISKNITVQQMDFPSGCILLSVQGSYQAVYNLNDVSKVECGASNITRTRGNVSTSLVNIALDIDEEEGVTIVLEGPADVWFGVGFNAKTMNDLPYTIVVEGGEDGKLLEVKLGDHDQGHQLAASLKLVSTKINQGVKRVHLWRPLKGATEEHYTFSTAAATLNVIDAVGSSPDFSYHKDKGGATIHLVPVGNQTVPTCVCEGEVIGNIDGVNFDSNRCAREPIGDLVKQNNPTCDIRTYKGGLSCCHHQWFLLDEDQEIPPQIEEYYLKFRIYYDEYDPSKYQNLVRFYFQTEAFAGEYDVPQCKDGTPPEECIHTITARFKVQDLVRDQCSIRSDPGCTGNGTGIELVYVSGHCHAGTCISLELYNMDTGDLICSQNPIRGNGTEIYDEESYIAIPPCLFGSTDEGLLASPHLSLNTTLQSIKRCNSTYGHYGEMASWQMRGTMLQS